MKMQREVIRLGPAALVELESQLDRLLDKRRDWAIAALSCYSTEPTTQHYAMLVLEKEEYQRK
jgi:hypothetical protein